MNALQNDAPVKNNDAIFINSSNEIFVAMYVIQAEKRG